MKRSLAPAEYALAVSTKLMPRSSAACTISTESCSFALRPNIIVPRHSELTFTPVRPRFRYSTRKHLVDRPGAAANGPAGDAVNTSL